MTEHTFAGVANILSAMPAQQPWDERTSTVYALALKDWDDSLATKAVMKALMTRKWRPSPSELREIALQVRRIKVPTPTMHEQIRHVVLYHQADERERAAERLIHAGKVSPLINEVVDRLGGWRSVGRMTAEELSGGIDKEMSECLESGVIEPMLSLPMPTSDQPKMIGQ